MTAADLLRALDLPASARVDRRVPKTLLTQYGGPTAADRRKINEGVEHLQWVAALKPGTVGVAEYRDDSREYLEIAVLRLTVRQGGKLDRLVELVHRAVPYPVVAVAEQNGRAQLSLAHKRWSHGQASKTVLEGDLVAVDIAPPQDSLHKAFWDAMALGHQPRANLFLLYQGWLDTLLALKAAFHTNAFTIVQAADRREVRRLALIEFERLKVEVEHLRAAAVKEKQLRKQVELNLKLQRLETDLADARARL
jgi:hypothetical protein